MKFNKKVWIIFLICISSSPFLSAEEKDAADPDRYIQILLQHNQQIHTYQARIKSQGFLQRNKFQATGSVWADNGTQKLKIRFEDLIFRAPISIFLMQQNIITLYYPPRKRKIITSKNKFQPAYEAGIPLEADILEAMIQGNFFVPPNIIYKKMDTGKKNLILVNDKYIINYILNEHDLPKQAILQQKKTKKKITIVFTNYKKNQNTYLPYYIKIYPPVKGNYLHIRIQSLKINKKIGNVWNLK